MIEEAISEQELAFLKELERYENMWVAIVAIDGQEIVVGSGRDAVEAMERAEAKGYPDAALLKLGRFDRGYIPASAE